VFVNSRFAIGQFACSNYISVELTDIVASLAATGAIVALLQVWKPSEPIVGGRFTRGPAVAGAAVADPVLEAEVRRKDDEHRDTRGEIVGAYAPYLIVIAVFSIAQIGPIKTFLENAGTEFGWPGLDITNADGEAVSATTFKLNWLSAAGTLLLISGALTMLALRISPGRALRVYGRTLDRL
jgi:lactate permease